MTLTQIGFIYSEESKMKLAFAVLSLALDSSKEEDSKMRKALVSNF
jgi:hypothetical protein